MLRTLLLVLFLSVGFSAVAQDQSDKSNKLSAPAEVESPKAESPESEDAESEQAPKPEANFSGEGSIGWISNKGNTNNESLNADLKAALEKGKGLHSFAIAAKKVSDKDVVIAERYLFTQKFDYSVSERTYAFESLRYDDDRFDGYEYQASATIGIGWHLIDRDTCHLKLELGAGYRKAEVTATGVENNEAVSRLSEHYDTNLGETSQFYQDLLIESGDSNTTTEFTAGLKVNVSSKLALKVSYNIKHSSDPAVGNESTDRTTAVNLVFGF